MDLTCRHVTGCNSNAEISDSGTRRGSHHQHGPLEEMKILDVSRSTFNEIGRDQYNQHNFYGDFVVHHHHHYFHSRGTLEGLDPPMNTKVVSDDCNPTAIVTITTIRTTNVSFAPYFADFRIIDLNSEGEEDMILTVERYVHAICFVVPVPSCSTVLILSGPVFGIHFSLIPNSRQVAFDFTLAFPFPMQLRHRLSAFLVCGHFTGLVISIIGIVE